MHTVNLAVILIAAAVAALCSGVTTLTAGGFMFVGTGITVCHFVGNSRTTVATKGTFLIMAGRTRTYKFQIAFFALRIAANATKPTMGSGVVVCVGIPIVAVEADIEYLTCIP